MTSLEDQLAIEIDLESTEIEFRDNPNRIKKGLSSETRNLVKVGHYTQGTFDCYMLPLDETPKVGESIFIIQDEYKITEIEDLTYGYHLTLSPAL